MPQSMILNLIHSNVKFINFKNKNVTFSFNNVSLNIEETCLHLGASHLIPRGGPVFFRKK